MSKDFNVYKWRRDQLNEDLNKYVDKNKRIVNFYTLIPIYKEEREIALEKGNDYLIKLFKSQGIDDIIKINRKKKAIKNKYI